MTNQDSQTMSISGGPAARGGGADVTSTARRSHVVGGQTLQSRLFLDPGPLRFSILFSTSFRCGFWEPKRPQNETQNESKSVPKSVRTPDRSAETVSEVHRSFV